MPVASASEFTFDGRLVEAGFTLRLERLRASPHTFRLTIKGSIEQAGRIQPFMCGSSLSLNGDHDLKRTVDDVVSRIALLVPRPIDADCTPLLRGAIAEWFSYHGA
jgi:hypothetical protein